MPTTVIVGETINFTAQFLSYNTINDSEMIIDPSSVNGSIYKYDPGTKTYKAFNTFVPAELKPGHFTFDWTTTEVGKFQIDFVANMSINQQIINSRFIFIGPIQTIDTLDANNLTYYLGELSPLYQDPELVLKYFPDGDLTEISELIYWYSNELLSLLNVPSITDITPIMQDYILASVLCDLSKVYTFNGGMGGFTNSESITLGDLAVKNSTGNSSSSKSTDRGSASTWCEMALVLRSELTNSKAGMKAIVRGSNFANPIPQRRLKRIG